MVARTTLSAEEIALTVPSPLLTQYNVVVSGVCTSATGVRPTGMVK